MVHFSCLSQGRGHSVLSWKFSLWRWLPCGENRLPKVRVKSKPNANNLYMQTHFLWHTPSLHAYMFTLTYTNTLTQSIHPLRIAFPYHASIQTHSTCNLYIHNTQCAVCALMQICIEGHTYIHISVALINLK